MMTNDKMIQFVKRWREIEKREANLDFERSQLARDIRAEFPTGENGDNQFINWCGVELGIAPYGAQELLLRATAVKIVPDETTWKRVGGFKAIRPLQDLVKRDQVVVLEAAKTSGKAIRTIMKERDLGPKLPELAPVVPRTYPAIGAQTHKPVRDVKDATPDVPLEEDVYDDAVKLAKYIAKTGKDIPREIMKLISKYTTVGVSVRKKAA